MVVEVTPLSDGDCWYARGRVDARAFAEAVAVAELGYCYGPGPQDDEPPNPDRIDRIASAVVYESWRFVPSANWSEYRIMAFPAEPGSRGSFLATVVYLDDVPDAARGGAGE